MRWPVFAIFAFVFLAIELSLREVLALRSLGSISPSFVAVLVVFSREHSERKGSIRPKMCSLPREIR